MYYDAAGVGGSSWSEMGNVKDVTLNLETGEADVTVRANTGWRAMVGTLKEATIEFTMQWDTEDAGFAALQDAFMNNLSIGIAVMDGEIATPGSQGLTANCSVISFSRSEPLEEAMTVDVTLKPTYSATPPAWLEVT
jgi:hypothetical protein